MPPPRTRSLRDLTDDELKELASLEPLTSGAPVPRLPASPSATPSYRMEIGDVQMRDPGAEEAWLDELIGRPEPAPVQRPMLSAVGAGATFAGEDTPEARQLVQQRGMRLTSPPSDDDLLAGLTSARPATMPELDDGGDALDELIRAESSAMDREQSAAAARAAAPARKSREDAVRESLQAPTRAQGGLALLFDALLGTKTLDAVNERQRGYQGALAQARMEDVAAGERSDEREADRQMTDARMALTARGQDLAAERAAENQELRRQLAEQSGNLRREEGAAGRAAALERAQLYAQSHGGPEVSPEQRQAGEAAFLAQQANVPRAKALAFMSGRPTADTTPEEIERLQVFRDQLGMLSSRKQEEVVVGGMKREAGSPDTLEGAAQRKLQDPEKRLEARNSLLAQHAAINDAWEAWKAMSPRAKQVVARVGGGDSTFASATRSALLDGEDQARAAKIQALANALIKAQSGASVTANEWRRVATEIGLPQDAVSIFNDPASIDAWLQKSRNGFRMVRDSTLQTYKGLFDEGAR